MSILVDESGLRFHLNAGDTSYIMEATEPGHLAHWYWGPKIRPDSADRRAVLIPRPFAPNPDPDRGDYSLDALPQEFPTWGRGDYRLPAYQIRLANGSPVTDFHFQGYRIEAGKPRVSGLPHLHAGSPKEAETLVVTLADEAAELTVDLYYTVFSEFNAIVRSAKFENHGITAVTLERALSASVDLPTRDFDVIRLMGSWARERAIVRGPLGIGLESVESRRGASSHQANPFMALVEPSAGETHGRVYGMN